MMENLINIENAKYIQDMFGNNSAIQATFNGKVLGIPIDPANTEYAEIIRQVEVGELTIQEADSE